MREESSDQTGMSNIGYESLSALQIRLDTQPVLENIETFLKGKRIMYSKDQTGHIIAKIEEIGEPKANREGIQSILTILSSILNSQVVQGNLDRATYEAYMENFHIDLATEIVTNCKKWGIKETDLNLIIDFVVNLVLPFMSRTINNEERNSYASTIKSFESRSESGGNFSIPFFTSGSGKPKR